MMNWNQLLSTKRIGKEVNEETSPHRSPFEIDADRIMFSSSFRRLADKMQVHGPLGNANIRNRLTHSLEVSRVGRSLGAMVGRVIVEDYLEGTSFTAFDISHIVSAACLAHDIGNPPFGHTGEDIISNFFAEQTMFLPYGQSNRTKAEWRNFEGNAQGFRVLTKTQGWREEGGLQLTAATLATFTKYPWGIEHKTEKGKYGFLGEEEAAFREVAKSTGLIELEDGKWCRHPLVYLVEASDDLCYCIVDLEDGFKMNLVSFAEYEDILSNFVDTTSTEYKSIQTVDKKVTYLRSKAISHLVEIAAGSFTQNHDEILKGVFKGDLFSGTTAEKHLDLIKSFSKKRIYHGVQRRELDIKCYTALTKVLTHWTQAFSMQANEIGSYKSHLLMRTLPEGLELNSHSNWVPHLLDYIGGMTDHFVLEQAEILP